MPRIRRRRLTVRGERDHRRRLKRVNEDIRHPVAAGIIQQPVIAALEDLAHPQLQQPGGNQPVAQPVIAALEDLAHPQLQQPVGNQPVAQGVEEPELPIQLPLQHRVTEMTNRCPHCAERYTEQECSVKAVFRKCCFQGKITLPPIQPLSHNGVELFVGEAEHSRRFLENIRHYNADMAMATWNAEVNGYAEMTAGDDWMNSYEMESIKTSGEPHEDSKSVSIKEEDTWEDGAEEDLLEVKDDENVMVYVVDNWMKQPGLGEKNKLSPTMRGRKMKKVRKVVAPVSASEEEASPADLDDSGDSESDARSGKRRCHSAMLWSGNREVQTADWWQANELLYNKSHPDYRDTRKKNRIIEKHAKQLGIKSTELLSWMQTMRTRYGKICQTKFGQERRMTERTRWINNTFSFLRSHIERAPGRQLKKVPRDVITSLPTQLSLPLPQISPLQDEATLVDIVPDVDSLLDRSQSPSSDTLMAGASGETKTGIRPKLKRSLESSSSSGVHSQDELIAKLDEILDKVNKFSRDVNSPTATTSPMPVDAKVKTVKSFGEFITNMMLEMPYPDFKRFAHKVTNLMNETEFQTQEKQEVL